MRKYLAIISVLACLTISAKAQIDNNAFDHLVYHWRVVLGNSGPIPKGSYSLNNLKDGQGMRLDKYDKSQWGGAEKPTDATLMSYKDVSAAARIDYEKMMKADFTNWNDREKAMLRMYRDELKKIYALLKAIDATVVVPAYSRAEMQALLKAVM